MKKVIIFLLCLINLSIYAQDKNQPVIYLNGTEIDLDNVFLNPMSIDSIKVEKKTLPGQIQIFSKSTIEFVNLNQVLKDYLQVDTLKNNILFIIDDKIIKNEKKLLIDNSYFIKVTENNLNEVNYLDETFKGLILVNIKLKSKKEEDIILR